MAVEGSQIMVTDMQDLFRRAAAAFGAKVRGVRDDQWYLPTPCADWDVRTLVNHVVYEMRWAVPLFDGATVAAVGSRFDGDLLGEVPVLAWEDAGAAAVASGSAPGALQRTVHLSFGDVPGEEYATQLFADLVVHGWDLARATGQDDTIDPDLLGPLGEWFTDREASYRGAGAIGPRPALPADANPQTVLLAEFGRTA
jgi:uncharacterized protein (TIGR03086 family)